MTMRHLVIPSLLTFSVLTIGCGDDSTAGTGVDDSTSDATGSTTATTATTQPAESSSEGSTGTETLDSSGSESSGSGSESTGEPVATHWGALVLGTLHTDDLDMAKTTHDQVAMGGQDPAMARRAPVGHPSGTRRAVAPFGWAGCVAIWLERPRSPTSAGTGGVSAVGRADPLVRLRLGPPALAHVLRMSATARLAADTPTLGVTP